MSKNHKISNAESVKSTHGVPQNIEINLDSNVPKFPVSLEFFKKWTYYEEIIELSLRSASCGDENKYQKLKQMPKFSENAIRNYYTLFYLKPKIREKYPIRMKPIPKHAKEKLLQIPNNTKSKHSSISLLGNKRRRLDIEEENPERSDDGDSNDNVAIIVTRNGMEMQTKSDDGVSNYFHKFNGPVDVEQGSSNLDHNNKRDSADSNVESKNQLKPKEPIKILENKILPPINSIQNKNTNCDNGISDCIFCHFPLSDFKKSTNVTDLIKQSIFDSNEIDEPDILYNEIRVFYIKCLLKILSPDETANLSMSLQKYKLLSKYHEICNKCKVRYNVERADNTYIINTSFTDINPVRSVNNTYDNRDDDNLRVYYTQDDDNDEIKKGRIRFINVLRENLQERLSRNWNLNDYIPIDYITFKETISHKEPLQQIIKFVASSEEILSNIILQDDDLYDLILKEFYLNYFTKDEICEKYPLTFNPTYLQLSPGRQQTYTKSKIENSNIRISKYSMESSNCANGVYYSAIFSNKFLLSYISRKCQDPIKQQIILNQIKTSFPSLTRSRTNLNPTELSNVEIETNSKLMNLEETRPLMLSKINKKQSLGYILLTSHGFKHKIAKEILSLTFEEFRSLTSIYEADQLKSDIVSMDVYRRVVVQKNIWPINLFIKLKTLIAYLLNKNVEFTKSDADNLLEHIPPTILHWSDLIQTTNFKYCVSVDYLKCYGKILNMNNTELFENRCAAYYSRCWKHNQWIWQTPKMTEVIMDEINQVFLRHIFKRPWSTPVILSDAAKTAISPVVLPPTIVTTSTRSINSELLPASNTSIISSPSSPASSISSEASSCTTVCQNIGICNNQTQLNDCLKIHNLSEIYIKEEQTISVGNPSGEKNFLNLQTVTNCTIRKNLPQDSNLKEIANHSNGKKSLDITEGDKQANLGLVTIRKKPKKMNSCTTYNTKDRTDLVLQLSHKFRALPLQIEEIPPNNLQNSLANTKCTNAMKATKNDIQISQELSTNCSVFNNIAAVTPRKSAFGKVFGKFHSTSSTLIKNPSIVDVDVKFYSHSRTINAQANINSADSTGSLEIVNRIKSEKVIQTKCVTRTNTFRSNLTQSSKFLHIEHTETIKKFILYRHLLHMDFFQALNVQHIIKYQIPTITLGSTHIQALIKFDDIKIRLNNKSLLALFPTWSRSMKWHLFTILNDIKEYHYTYSCNRTFDDVRDLRVRILHCLFQTTPKYSLAILNFQSSNPELANCENMNYVSKILSYSSLSKAIQPRVLEKISKYKIHYQTTKDM